MPLKDWSEVAPEPLAFPIGGKTYTVPDVNARASAHLQRVVNEKSTPYGEYPLDQVLLGCTDECMEADDPDAPSCGSVYHELLADGVSQSALQRVVGATFAGWQGGRAVAEAVWGEQDRAPGLEPGRQRG